MRSFTVAELGDFVAARRHNRPPPPAATRAGRARIRQYKSYVILARAPSPRNSLPPTFRTVCFQLCHWSQNPGPLHAEAQESTSTNAMHSKIYPSAHFQVSGAQTGPWPAHCNSPLRDTGPFCVVSARQALWQAVRACVADFKLTGLVSVPLSRSDGRSKATSSSGRQPPDTVLVPREELSGSIDRGCNRLTSSPNYFHPAWRARLYLKGPTKDLRTAMSSRFQSTLLLPEVRTNFNMLRVPLACNEHSKVNPCLRTANWSLDARPRPHPRVPCSGACGLAGTSSPASSLRLASRGLGNKIEIKLMIFLTGGPRGR